MTLLIYKQRRCFPCNHDPNFRKTLESKGCHMYFSRTLSIYLSVFYISDLSQCSDDEVGYTDDIGIHNCRINSLKILLYAEPYEVQLKINIYSNINYYLVLQRKPIWPKNVEYSVKRKTNIGIWTSYIQFFIGDKKN